MTIVLMAGGGGTRLWPLSRAKNPKQFIDLGNGRILLRDAFERARKTTSLDNIYVATSHKYEPQIKKILPEINTNRIFYEPEKRDTTAAFASVAIRLQHLNKGNVPTTFMWADHIFTNEQQFLDDLKKIPVILSQYPNYIVIVGHTPITPETTLGYMEVGQSLNGYKDVFYLQAFKEKPDLATAKKFLSAGNYFWNLGYFSLLPDYLLTELAAQSPELKKPLSEFSQAIITNDDKAIGQAYSNFPKVAIEYTLIEKTQRIMAITGDYGWADVGYWSTVQEIFGKDGDHAPYGHHIHVNSKGNYVYNTTDKVISLLGMEDTIVVVTNDAILITKKDECHNIKELITKLEQQGHIDIL